MQKYFRDGFDWNNLKSLSDEKMIETVEYGAKNLEKKVMSCSAKHSSIEYFVLDAKLLLFIEHLDKIKCKENSELLLKKIEVLRYIQNLQQRLDEFSRNNQT